MIVGIPREVKDRENRVSTTPAGVGEYVKHGHTVIVENDAGLGSGVATSEYADAGARIVDSHAGVFAEAEMIVKVKEPIRAEYDLLRPNQLLYTYLHLAAEEELTKALIRQKVQAVAYETVQLGNGSLPLLTPMSEVAGRRSRRSGRRCAHCRRWHRRNECRPDGPGYGRECHDRGQEHRQAALP
jgi:alanine dehydrogenase